MPAEGSANLRIPLHGHTHGAHKGTAALGAAVAVGSAADEEAVGFGELDELVYAAGLVLGMVRLDAVEGKRQEVGEMPAHATQPRMPDEGQSAGGVDGVDGLLDRHPCAGHKRGFPAPDVAVEGFLHRAHVPGIAQFLGDVHAAHGAGGSRQDRVARDGETEGFQLFEGEVEPSAASFSKRGEDVLEMGRFGPYPQSHDVHLESVKRGRDLHAVQESQAMGKGGGRGFTQPRDGVVIRHRQCSDAQFRPPLHDGFGSIRSIGIVGMNVEICKQTVRGSLSLQTVQHAIDEARRLVISKPFGDLDGLVHRHLFRDVGSVPQFKQRHPEDIALDTAHPFRRPIGQRPRDFGVQSVAVLHDALDQLERVGPGILADRRAIVRNPGHRGPEIIQGRFPVVFGEIETVEELHRTFASRTAALPIEGLHSCSSRLTISMAVHAASNPLLPDLVPARSTACSMVSVVSTPNATGTWVSSVTWATPFDTSAAT